MLKYLEAFRAAHFDVDVYLNPVIPPNPSKYFPRPVSHFLGYRNKAVHEPGNVFIAFWALISTYVGLLLVGLAFRQIPWIETLHPPVLIGSLGAAAILEFNILSSPLAQPRNTLLGHILSAIIGVSVSKGLSSSADDAYLLAPLACALASVAMTLTGTLHPPGGATAVLAVTDPGLRRMGWWLIPVIMVSCAIMVAVACLMGNLARRYPIWWWSVEECGQFWRRAKKGDEEAVSEEERKASVASSEDSTIAASVLEEKGEEIPEGMVILSHRGLVYPPDFELQEEERGVLDAIVARLEQKYRRHEVTKSHSR